MTILLYQIGIFLAILISSFFSKGSRNTAVILISIFTIVQVFMSWLLALQFVTIFISYVITEQIFFSKNLKVSETYYNSDTNKITKIIEDTKQVGKKTKSGFEIGCGSLLLLFALLGIIKIIMAMMGYDEVSSYPVQIILVLIAAFFGFALTFKNN